MRVAVFGAGYAGLTLARNLERSLPDDVDLVVVDDDGEHVLVHEIHRVIRRPGLADEIRLDLDEVLAETTIREATVTDVDPDAGVATLDTGEDIAYDFAGVALGSRTAYYDLPGIEVHATPLERIEHAESIRREFLAAADAGTADDPASVVVGGAGLSGIQVAGELVALAREEDIAASVDVQLLEQAPSVAPAFPENFQRAVHEELTARDVTVRTGTDVQSADADAIQVDPGEAIAYDQFVWTGGIRGPDSLGGERPVVRNTLRHGDGTFVIGDSGRVVDTDGEAVPASAQAAVRMARVAGTNIGRLVGYERDGASGFEPRLAGYTFDSPGWLVSVGDGAVAQVGPTVLTGRAAKTLKTSVGAGYLTSVGAVENALDLVREELGWPSEDADEAVDVDVEAADGESDLDDEH
jgi:NADH dehydrogenase